VPDFLNLKLTKIYKKTVPILLAFIFSAWIKIWEKYSTALPHIEHFFQHISLNTFLPGDDKHGTIIAIYLKNKFTETKKLIRPVKKVKDIIFKVIKYAIWQP